MSNIAIHVENLSKKYEITIGTYRHDTLRDQISHAFRSLFQANGRARPHRETFWALKDVSFEVEPGEVLGIIGRNGAGKSTLLKILSRITRPTEGRANIYGRIGSLLEVGAGFHSELTGRENIYLNGAILGMKKAEIDRKFDQILDFSGVEKFVDAPVKRYSSGMYVRLAFAVAAHLEPEILIIDEVLSVGDADFNKKCLKKMENVRQEGRTVIFVSHSMPAITRLCQRAILLDRGSVLADGPSHKVVSQYLNSGLGIGPVREWQDSVAPGGEVVRLCAARVRGSDGEIADVTDIRQSIRIEMEYEILKPGYVLLPNFEFRDELGALIFCSLDIDPIWQRRSRPAGRYVSTVKIPGNLLSEGTIVVGVGCETVDPCVHQFYETEVVAFHVIDNLHPDSARGYFQGNITGSVRPRLAWHTQLLSSLESKSIVSY
jgi:homopolymeric O-antigen transport system ATP-binding protein